MNHKKDMVRYVISLTLLIIFMVSVQNKKEETKIENVDLGVAYAKSEVEQVTLPTMEPMAVVNNSDILVESKIDKKNKQIDTYIVTAFMLNVREKDTFESSIVRVLNQNDSIEVISDFSSEWLELKLGGFVRSTYVAQNSKMKSLQASATVEQEVKDEKKLTVLAEARAEVKKITVHAVPEPTNGNAMIPINKLNQVNMKSNLSASDVEQMFKGTALESEGLGTAFIAVEDKYGINALFSVAVAKLESGNGKSRISREKNNLFGLNATDGNEFHGALKFDSKSDSVMAFGKIISDFYMNKGLTTVSKISGKYCPANPNWTRLISSIMEGDYHKVK
jgi:beta-N-acetylglucosaminidase